MSFVPLRKIPSRETVSVSIQLE